jgi:hypothetical protein
MMPATPEGPNAPHEDVYGDSTPPARERIVEKALTRRAPRSRASRSWSRTMRETALGDEGQWA